MPKRLALASDVSYPPSNQPKRSIRASKASSRKSDRKFTRYVSEAREEAMEDKKDLCQGTSKINPCRHQSSGTDLHASGNPYAVLPTREPAPDSSAVNIPTFRFSDKLRPDQQADEFSGDSAGKADLSNDHLQATGLGHHLRRSSFPRARSGLRRPWNTPAMRRTWNSRGMTERNLKPRASTHQSAYSQLPKPIVQTSFAAHRLSRNQVDKNDCRADTLPSLQPINSHCPPTPDFGDQDPAGLAKVRIHAFQIPLEMTAQMESPGLPADFVPHAETVSNTLSPRVEKAESSQHTTRQSSESKAGTRERRLPPASPLTGVLGDSLESRILTFAIDFAALYDSTREPQFPKPIAARTRRVSPSENKVERGGQLWEVEFMWVHHLKPTASLETASELGHTASSSRRNQMPGAAEQAADGLPRIKHIRRRRPESSAETMQPPHLEDVPSLDEASDSEIEAIEGEIVEDAKGHKSLRTQVHHMTSDEEAEVEVESDDDWTGHNKIFWSR